VLSINFLFTYSSHIHPMGKIYFKSGLLVWNVSNTPQHQISWNSVVCNFYLVTAVPEYFCELSSGLPHHIVLLVVTNVLEELASTQRYRQDISPYRTIWWHNLEDPGPHFVTMKTLSMNTSVKTSRYVYECIRERKYVLSILLLQKWRVGLNFLTSIGSILNLYLGTSVV
jgi:hypothetical protein